MATIWCTSISDSLLNYSVLYLLLNTSKLKGVAHRHKPTKNYHKFSLLISMTSWGKVDWTRVEFFTLVSAFQLIVPVFLIFQYLINLVPGRSRVPSGRFSSRNVAVMAGTTRGQGRLGRLGRKYEMTQIQEITGQWTISVLGLSIYPSVYVSFTWKDVYVYRLHLATRITFGLNFFTVIMCQISTNVLSAC